MFTKKELLDNELPWARPGDDYDYIGVKVLSFEEIDKRRWYTVNKIVYMHEGRFWRLTVFYPLSELQENDVFLDDEPKIEEVFPFEHVVTKYQTLKEREKEIK